MKTTVAPDHRRPGARSVVVRQLRIPTIRLRFLLLLSILSVLLAFSVLPPPTTWRLPHCDAAVFIATTTRTTGCGYPRVLRTVPPVTTTTTTRLLGSLLPTPTPPNPSETDTALRESPPHTTTTVVDKSVVVAVLLTVPLAWGTYAPVVQYLTQQQHVPGLVFCAAYYTVAAVTLQSLHNDSLLPRHVRGGIELGFYLFVANLCQLIGLQSVPADRAGFLIQLTTIGVPLLQAAAASGSRRNIPLSTWGACGLALVGVLVFDDDTPYELGKLIPAVPTASSGGDGWIIAAALGYSWHVVRLGRYARTVADALPLAACKATTEAGLSLGLVGILSLAAPIPIPTTTTGTVNGVTAYVMDAGRDIVAFATTISTMLVEEGVGNTVTMFLPVFGAILWTGWVTCAYTIFAQSYGQSRVPPTEANLIYSIQPLCTALFAYILLGETLSPSGVVGASFIAAAVYIVAVTDDVDDTQKVESD